MKNLFALCHQIQIEKMKGSGSSSPIPVGYKELLNVRGSQWIGRGVPEGVRNKKLNCVSDGCVMFHSTSSV